MKGGWEGVFITEQQIFAISRGRAQWHPAQIDNKPGIEGFGSKHRKAKSSNAPTTADSNINTT
ncbi:MAG: hypothetical protein MRJ65_05930 [Candidatus Brocadiaceae bacterium]|nr:hypothetical protein [Candidatus Brocadiaceae bacterium]